MRVALFVTCLVDQMRPTVGVATVKLLRQLGCDVTFNPEQTCCGQPAYTMGSRAECLEVAQRAIDQLDNDPADWIVIPSGSCAAMFHHYVSLFEDKSWKDRASSVLSRTREFTSFIVNTLDVSDVQAQFTGRVTWHDACHGLRDLGITDEPRRLLQHVRGLEYVELEHANACCGFGGAFSVSYPNISTAMADRKLDEVEEAEIDVIVSGDVGCLMQLGDRLIERKSSVRTMHITELLTQGS